MTSTLTVMWRRSAITRVLRQHPEGATMRVLRQASGVPEKDLLLTLADMIAAGTVATSTDADGRRIYLRVTQFGGRA